MPEETIERLVRWARRLGFNPVRVRWKLIRLEQRWRLWQRRTERAALHIRYEHKTCGRCGAVNDRAAARCTRCDEALSSRSLQMIERLGIVTPRALSVSTLLALAILVVYVREMAARPGEGYFSVDSEVLLRFGALWPPLVQSGQWWRLATAIFLHIGLPHLVFNVVALGQVGPLVEETFGRARLIFYFMLTGVLGFVGSYALGLAGVTAGASGALMGLVGVAAGWGQRDGTSIGRGVRNRMLKWGLYTMVFGYFIGANNIAHASGFVAGALLGWATPSARVRRTLRWPDVILGLVGTSAATLSVACALFPPSPLENSLQRVVASTLAPFVHQPGVRFAVPDALQQQMQGAQPSRERLPRDYAGPLDLPWGMTVPEVRAALEPKLTFYAEADLWARMGLIDLSYRGIFGGRYTDDILLGFDGGKLRRARVILSEPNRAAALDHWRTLVDALTASHGPPSEQTPASAEATSSADEDGLPEATWLFRNAVTVRIRVEKSTDDPPGQLCVVWLAVRERTGPAPAQPSE